MKSPRRIALSFSDATRFSTQGVTGRRGIRARPAWVYMLGFGSALAILLAVGVLQYRTIQALVETDGWVAHTNRVLDELDRAVSAMEAMESDARGYVATGDESLVNKEQDWGSEAEEHIRLLRDLTADNPRQRQNVESLGRMVEQKIAFMHRLVGLRREQGLDPATQLIATNQGKKLMSEIRASIAAMEAEEYRLLAIRQSASHTSARRAAVSTVLGSLLALVFGLAASWIIHRDTLERKRAEEALCGANTYNRRLIEASLDPLVTISADGKITDANTATEKVTGLSHEELIGTDFSDYFTDAAKARAGYHQVFREGWVQDYELEVRHRNGQLTPVLYNASLYRDEAGQVVGVFAAARDITERKRAEEALRRASAYNRTLIEASLDPLVTITSEGRISDVNEATVKVSGVPRAKLIGTDFSSYFTEPEQARAGYHQVFEKGFVTDYPLTVRHTEGHLTDVLYNASVYKDSEGTVLGVFAAARDITDRKRAEEEIQKLNEQLEQRVRERTAELESANKELEAFTYSVSHDLRAPLRHVDGFSKLLVERHRAELSPDAQEYLATIRDSVLQMGTLIDELLNLARVGRTQLSMQVTGLNSLVEEVRTDLDRANPEHLIVWKIETLPFVECDPALIKQVFANLLSNAVKFTRPRKPALIEVGVTSQDGARAVFVRDNGVGFSMKYANKLFGVFQRLHRAEDFEGTGVGLATVQRIIHKHRGRVWAEAELDKGATFYFTLGSDEDPQPKEPTGSGGNP